MTKRPEMVTLPSGITVEKKGVWLPESCPDYATLHDRMPADFNYDTGRSKTHRQAKCPTCGLWSRWIPKNEEGGPPMGTIHTNDPGVALSKTEAALRAIRDAEPHPSRHSAACVERFERLYKPGPLNNDQACIDGGACSIGETPRAFAARLQKMAAEALA